MVCNYGGLTGCPYPVVMFIEYPNMTGTFCAKCMLRYWLWGIKFHKFRSRPMMRLLPNWRRR